MQALIYVQRYDYVYLISAANYKICKTVRLNEEKSSFLALNVINSSDINNFNAWTFTRSQFMILWVSLNQFCINFNSVSIVLYFYDIDSANIEFSFPLSCDDSEESANVSVQFSFYLHFHEL